MTYRFRALTKWSLLTLGAGFLLSGANACKKSSSSNAAVKSPTAVAPAPAPAPATGNKATAPVLPPDVSTLVMSPSELALSVSLLDTNNNTPTAIDVQEVVVTGSNVSYRTVHTAKLDSKGYASFAGIPAGKYYRVVPRGAQGPTGQTAFVRIPNIRPSSALRLLAGPVNHTYMSVPNRNTTAGADLAEQVIKTNPAYFTNGTLNLPLIKKTGAVLGSAAKKSGKPTSATVLTKLAAQVDTNTQALLAKVHAKKKTASLWLRLMDSTAADDSAIFDQIIAVDQSVEENASSVKTSSADSCSAAAAQAEANAFGDASFAKDNDAQSVIAGLPLADVKIFQQPMVEQSLLGYLGSIGFASVAADGGTAVPIFAAADKALLAATSITALLNGDYNSLVDQISGYFMVPDPSALPPNANNLQSAWIALAQGADQERQGNNQKAQALYQAAVASIRVVLGTLNAADTTTVNNLVADLLPAFTNLAAFAADLTNINAGIAGASNDAFAGIQAATAGTATDFSYGASCSLFAGIESSTVQTMFGGVGVLPELCFLADPTSTCDSLSPNLAASAASGNPTGPSYCDYVSFKIGAGKCSALAAQPRFIQQQLAMNATGFGAATTIAAVCIKDDAALPCASWSGAAGITDSSSNPSACDFVPPPAYQPTFTAVGGSCDDFVKDWSNLGDNWGYDQFGNLGSFLAGTLGQLTPDQPLLCTHFTGATDGSFPARCEDISMRLGFSVVTAGDNSGNCVFSMPTLPTPPSFTLGGDCADMMSTANAPFWPSFVTSLSLDSPVLCGNFQASSSVADCKNFSNPADPFALQIIAVTLQDATVNCQLDTGGFVAQGPCTAFQALKPSMQAMFVQAANPGDIICSAAGSSNCADIAPMLVTDGTNCKLPTLSYTPGAGTCADLIAGEPTSSADAVATYIASYVGQLSPSMPVLCTGAAAKGITDCSTIDPSLVLVNDTCSRQPPMLAGGAVAPPPFSLGGECNDLLAQDPASWSAYVPAMQPTPTTASVTVCGNFAVNATLGVNSCADINNNLQAGGGDNKSCVVAFPTYTTSMSCADFSTLPSNVQIDAINVRAEVNAVLCTSVDVSPYGACAQITADPTQAWSHSAVDTTNGDHVDCTVSANPPAPQAL